MFIVKIHSRHEYSTKHRIDLFLCGVIVFVSGTVEHSDERATKIPKELPGKVLLLFNASQIQRRDCYVNEY